MVENYNSFISVDLVRNWTTKIRESEKEQIWDTTGHWESCEVINRSQKEYKILRKKHSLQTMESPTNLKEEPPLQVHVSIK
jgi:hypothetical protein